MHTVSLVLEAFQRGHPVLLRDVHNNACVVLAEPAAPEACLISLRRYRRRQTVLSAVEGSGIPIDGQTLTTSAEMITAGLSNLSTSDLLREGALTIAMLAGFEACVQSDEPLPEGDADEVAMDIPSVTVGELEQYRRRYRAPLERVAIAELPTRYADNPFHAHAFSSTFDGLEHLALVSPGAAEGPPLVRVHSECLTGDAFGSLRCDCGPQLEDSLRRIAGSPGGILIYLRGQEGRGIGLGNKMRAYSLQDKGLDTMEANRALGLPDDARDYAHAAFILQALGHYRIRLLTNNPEKTRFLQCQGIVVDEAVPLVIRPNPFNARYLKTKLKKFGHTLPSGDFDQLNISGFAAREI